jgi:ankyrin repeat protein
MRMRPSLLAVMSALLTVACVGGAVPPSTAPFGGTSPTASTGPAIYRGCDWPATVDIQPRESTSPVMAAVIEGDVRKLTALLESGASPDIVDEWQGTPLEFAISANCIPMVEVLLRFGSSVEHYVWSAPLYSAVNADNRDMVELLLVAGADPSWVGEAPWESALHAAVGIPRVSLLEVMLPFASDVDVSRSPDTRLQDMEFISMGSPLEHAAELGRLEAIELLVRAGAHVTPTAVYLGVRSGEADAVSLLLQLGPGPVSWHETDRLFLARYAESLGYDEIARRLREWQH